MGSRSRDSSVWVWVGVGATITTTIVATLGLFTLARSGSSAAPSESEQVLLQSSIVRDRKHLFEGVVTYLPLPRVPVEDTRRFQVTLFAVKDAKLAGVSRGEVVGSRSLQVGGVEEAKLSSASDKLSISPIGPTRRLIGKPGERATWAWHITPKEPGDYKLDLVIMTYQGTTDNPLYIINPPIPVNLTVTNTWSHRFKSIVGWINWVYVFLVAVAGILVIFREQVLTPLRNFRKASTTSSRDYDDLD